MDRPYAARDVHVTGTFDDWGKSEQLNKVGDHWEKEVDLPSADEEIHYKFVVDDEWIVDENAPKVKDGNNINNLLLPEQIKRKPAAAAAAKEAPTVSTRPSVGLDLRRRAFLLLLHLCSTISTLDILRGATVSSSQA